MESFGIEEHEYENKEGFTLICNKCGKSGKIVPITYYDKDYIHPNKIVIQLECSCGNRFKTIIHHLSHPPS